MKATQVLSSLVLLFVAARAIPVVQTVGEGDLVETRAVESDLIEGDFDLDLDLDLEDLVSRAVDADAKKKKKKEPTKSSTKFLYKGFPKKATCADRDFKKGIIQDAAEAAAKLDDKNKGVGRGDYPHEFRNDGNAIRNFRSACSGTKFEYPIFQTTVFNGGVANQAPGPDRVVISISKADKKGNIEVQFCGLMTHTGAVGNNFVQCTGW